MSARLTLECLTAAAPDGTVLFFDLTLSLGSSVTGLVGRNGAGKSTLIALLAGDREPLSGTINRSGRIGVLRQLPRDAATLADALGVAEALAVLERLDQGIGTLADTQDADWDLPRRLGAVLARVGLAGIDPARPTDGLSGGERTRAELARMLFDEPDFLLMDEPTNNLDAAGRAAVADLLATWPGGALVASHDRELLERVDRIVELTPVGVTQVGGGWSRFAEAREAAREQVAAELERAARDSVRQAEAARARTRHKAVRDRMGRAKRKRGGEPKILLDARAERSERTHGRNTQVAARQQEEAAAALDQAQAQVEIVTPLTIALPASRLPANRTVLQFEDVVCRHGDRQLFGPLSFSLKGPERVSVSGANGSGKTSLLRIAAGLAEPAAGTLEHGPGGVALLDQHVALLDSERDLVANMQMRHPGMSRGAAHEVLARFAFRNRDAQRPANTLSGGERLRAGLALVTGGPVPPQLLLLDEPTNHLDIAAIELLEAALAGWDGALLVVSHDRKFLDAVGFDREIRLAD